MVERNTSNEITKISIKYNDGVGNSSNYSIQENGDPINSFVFYQDETGSGIISPDSEELIEILKHENRDLIQERDERMKNKTIEIKERNELLLEQREESIQQRKVLREKQEEIHETRDYIIHSNNNHVIHSNHTGINSNHSVIVSNDVHGHKNVYHLEDNHEHTQEIYITKDTTDADLENVKKELVEKGVEINFKRLKRNSNGEITRVKIDVKNSKGSKQSIFATTDDGRPIDELLIQL